MLHFLLQLQSVCFQLHRPIVSNLQQCQSNNATWTVTMFQRQNVDVVVHLGDLCSLWRHVQGPHFGGMRKALTLAACARPSLWRHAQGPHFGGTRKALTLAACARSSLWRHAQGPHFGGTRKALTLAARARPSLWRHAQGPHFGGTHGELTLAARILSACPLRI